MALRLFCYELYCQQTTIRKTKNNVTSNGKLLSMSKSIPLLLLLWLCLVLVVFLCLLGISPLASVFVLAFRWWIERLAKPEPNGFLFWAEMVYWVKFWACWEVVNTPTFERLPLICYSIPFGLLARKWPCVYVYVGAIYQSGFVCTCVTAMLLVQNKTRQSFVLQAEYQSIHILPINPYITIHIFFQQSFESIFELRRCMPAKWMSLQTI